MALQRSITYAGRELETYPTLERRSSAPFPDFTDEDQVLPIARRARNKDLLSKSVVESKEKLPQRYEIQKSLGSGSYGQVWEAYDSQEDRMVAIKQISNLFDNSVNCKRNLREIAILSQLSHPFIVQLCDLPAVANTARFNEVFVILEICDSDMRKLIKGDVQLSEPLVVKLLYNLLAGLQYLHSAGVYHRDLKPANCLVNADCAVKICDFGLARKVDEPSDAPDLGTTWAHGWVTEDEDDAPVPKPLLKRSLTCGVGTRWYRAPEIILLSEDYTEKVDVWAVGCILAELVGILVEKERRRALFPGNTCYPLSPDQEHKADFFYHTQDADEQLNIIFDTLGTPSDESMSFLQNEEAQRYVKCFRQRVGSGLRDRLDFVPSGLLEIIESTALFDPRERPTVRRLLEHEVFEQIRDESVELVSTSRVTLDIDVKPDDLSPKDHDELWLRGQFLKEIRKFQSHPQCQEESVPILHGGYQSHRS